MVGFHSEETILETRDKWSAAVGVCPRLTCSKVPNPKIVNVLGVARVQDNRDNDSAPLGIVQRVEHDRVSERVGRQVELACSHCLALR